MRVKQPQGKQRKGVGILHLWKKGTLQQGMPKFNNNSGNSLVFGKRERGLLRGCPVNCMQGPESFVHVDGKDETTRHITSRSTKSRPHGLYVSGFIGQSKVNWLVETGALRNILP